MLESGQRCIMSDQSYKDEKGGVYSTDGMV
jgi:hypothetical protein